MPDRGPQPPYAALIAALAGTIVLLALVLWTGRAGRRRLHGALAFAAAGVLALAIALAEQVARSWEFVPAVLSTHLVLAFTGAGLALLALTSGVLYAAGRLPRRIHLALAGLFLSFVLLASSTGLLLFLTGSPRVP